MTPCLHWLNKLGLHCHEVGMSVHVHFICEVFSIYPLSEVGVYLTLVC